jgi:hypothetical protein
VSKVTLALVLLSCGALAPSVQAAETYTPGQKINKTFKDFARPLLDKYCLDCHDDAERKGKLSLENIGPVDETNAAVWKSVWAQLALKEMPPKKKKQPEVVERLQLADWIVGQMQHAMRDKGGFHAHLDPTKANFVDHDLLFGPLPKSIRLMPTSSPARIWRVTRQEHITRLNELINTEPKFNPSKPGLRTRGDVVPTNHGGELKLYFGVDRIIKWQGGTVAYATSVKSVPAVLASARTHGLENYPDFYTVNSAESTQILGKAGDIIRYMAFGPLSLAKPEQITDDPKTYKTVGDLRGLPTALVYSTKVVRPLTPVYQLMKQPGASDTRVRAASDYLFEALAFRPPTRQESDEYLRIAKASIQKLGKKDGAVLGLSAIFLDRDALFRPELATKGKPDRHGRVMLQDWELGLAVNHALSYIKPDTQLKKAILSRRMRTKADVKREVERMLADDSIRKPRVLRFFRDYFDYDLGGYICKDTAALARTGVGGGKGHYRAMFDATASMDRLIEIILKEDKDVFKTLLTTQKVVATKNDSRYFGKQRNSEEKKTAAAAKKKAGQAQAVKDAAQVKVLEKEVAVLAAKLKANPKDRNTKKSLDRKKKTLVGTKKRIANAKKKKKSPFNPGITPAKLTGPKIYARVSHRSFGNGSMKPDRVLATAPKGQRLGILTHPAWLVSHSDAMDNHAIHRGIWIRKRLLGGGIPDVPITVDAMLPDEPKATLRERMRVTREKYCWTCHKKMDPLGLPFEMYNHAGLLRVTELGKPVDTTGEIIGSGDPKLDGKVGNAIEMIQKLANSERAEQVFVRHAFRFWMGRNETVNDGPVLQDAHRAYKKSGGSMKALIASLVTSDAFLYRKVERNGAAK